MFNSWTFKRGAEFNGLKPCTYKTRSTYHMQSTAIWNEKSTFIQDSWKFAAYFRITDCAFKKLAFGLRVFSLKYFLKTNVGHKIVLTQNAIQNLSFWVNVGQEKIERFKTN